MTKSAEAKWMADAACRGMDTSLFYPSRGANKDVVASRKICNACQVQEECLDYALSLVEREDYGVWGGTSGRQRRAIREEKRRQAKLEHARSSDWPTPTGTVGG